MIVVFEVLAENEIDSSSIMFLKAWGHCKRRKEGRKLEYILKISNSVVVQGKMTISCCSAAFLVGVLQKSLKSANFRPGALKLNITVNHDTSILSEIAWCLD